MLAAAAPCPASGTPSALVNPTFQGGYGVNVVPNSWTMQRASSGSRWVSSSPSIFFEASAGIDNVLSQRFAVVPGCRYTVAYIINVPGGTSHFLPEADGQVLRDINGNSLEIFLANQAQASTPYTGYFTAASSSVLLSFGGSNAGAFYVQCSRLAVASS